MNSTIRRAKIERFLLFNPRLASSITLRSHEIMRQMRALFEAGGYQVIYGDTDSTFV